jgi:hypothetical protein
MAKLSNPLIAVLHTTIIFLLYVSPFWLDWKLIVLAIILNYAQMYIFGGCVLTIKQLKSTEISFQEWLLAKLHVKVNRTKFNRFLRWQLPFILLGLALFWQEILKIKPLLNI